MLSLSRVELCSSLTSATIITFFILLFSEIKTKIGKIPLKLTKHTAWAIYTAYTAASGLTLDYSISRKLCLVGNQWKTA